MLLPFCGNKGLVFFFYCIEWFAAFQIPVLLWLYKRWNICDCLVLRWCDRRALFMSVEEMKGCTYCKQLLRKKERNPILSCCTEARTGLIGYWFQFHYGESAFLATNMCSHCRAASEKTASTVRLCCRLCWTQASKKLRTHISHSSEWHQSLEESFLGSCSCIELWIQFS